jgi:hypothetical protein
VVAKFLKAVAAIKLENGASVMSLEYLLQSRTVLSTVTAPIILKTFNLLTPALFVLWALSPLGGQAGLRVISTRDSLTNATHNFTYLAFVSPFTNEGVNSASAEPLVPINAIFTSSIIGSAKAKNLAQDQYGNIKIPLYDSLAPSASNSSDWRSVPDDGDIQWSSLTGLPLHAPPSTGVANFNMETGYMVTSCSVSGQEWSEGFRQSLQNQSLWSGANYAFTQPTGSPFGQYNFSFLSLDIFSSDGSGTSGKILTVANCTVGMQYVEVQIQCDGGTCRSIAARPSKNPATHKGKFEVTSLNSTLYTPINGLGQSTGTMYMSFLADLTNATNPTVGCDTTNCPPSVIEAYLADPLSTVLQTSTTKLWTLGDATISRRMTQLFNTYWIDSVAPAPVSGN